MRANKMVYVYLTNMCDSKCRICNIWQNKGPVEINLDDLKRSILSMPKADWVIGGGEATLYPKIEELLLWMNEQKVKYSLLTNAVDYYRIFDVITKCQVKNITVSFDGINHDWQRRVKGNMLNILRLVEAFGDRIKFSYTLSRYNQDQFEDDMRFLSKFTRNKLYVCLEQQLPIFGSTDAKFEVRVGQIPKTLRDKLFDEKTQRYLYEFEKYGNKCTSPDDVYTITETGEVIHCQSFLSHITYGNIKDNTVAEIVEGAKQKIGAVSLGCKYKPDCKLVCQRRYDMF